jgi:hypothetical protein
MKEMSYSDGMKMYNHLKVNFCNDVRLVKWDNVTHIYVGRRHLDSFLNK